MKKIICILVGIIMSLSTTWSQSNEIGIKADYGYLINTYGNNTTGSPHYELDDMALSLGAYFEKKIFWKFSINGGLDYVQLKSAQVSVAASGLEPIDPQNYKYSAIKIPVNLSVRLTSLLYGSVGMIYHHDVSKFDLGQPFLNDKFQGFGYQAELGTHITLLNTLRIRCAAFAEMNNAYNLADNDSNAKIWYFGLRARTGIRF